MAVEDNSGQDEDGSQLEVEDEEGGEMITNGNGSNMEDGREMTMDNGWRLNILYACMYFVDLSVQKITL